MGSTKEKGKYGPGTGKYDPIKCIWSPFLEKKYSRLFLFVPFQIQSLFNKPISAMVTTMIVLVVGGVPIISFIAICTICF